MKKYIKISILLFVILNVITITSTFAITAQEINNMSQEQIMSLSDSDIESYLKDMQNAPLKDQNIGQAINRLSVEKQRREKVKEKQLIETSQTIATAINDLSKEEIKNLTMVEIDSYLEVLQNAPLKDQNIGQAINRLSEEKQSKVKENEGKETEQLIATAKTIAQAINDLSEEEIKNLTIVEIDSYLEVLQNAPLKDQNIGQAINRLSEEKQSRKEDTEEPEDEDFEKFKKRIYGMSKEELKTLTDGEIDSYIKRLEAYEGTGKTEQNTLVGALNKLSKEKQRRANAQNSVDYKNYTPSDPTGYTSFTSKAGTLIGIVRNIGVVVGIIILSLIGVKYMMGSVEQKADYKKSMVPFIIGAIFLIIAPTVVKIIYDISSRMV